MLHQCMYLKKKTFRKQIKKVISLSNNTQLHVFQKEIFVKLMLFLEHFI